VTKFDTLENILVILRDDLVLIDQDVAKLFGVETRDINKAVKNNPRKFLDGYVFEVTDEEFEILRGKFSTTKFAKRRSVPKVFTEKGLYMLATILKGDTATQATFQIIETFAKVSRSIKKVKK